MPSWLQDFINAWSLDNVLGAFPYVLGPFIVAVVGLTLVIPIARRYFTRPKWNAAVAQLAHQLALDHEPHAGGFDQADGDISGQSVSLSVETTGELQQVDLMVIQVGNLDYALLMKEHGRWLGPKLPGHGPEVWETSVGPPTPTGWPDFDERIDLRGASHALLTKLQQQPELRQQLLALVDEWSVFIYRGQMQLKSRTVTRTAAELHHAVQTLLTAVQSLS